MDILYLKGGYRLSIMLTNKHSLWSLISQTCRMASPWRLAQYHPLQVQGVFQFRQKVPRQIATVQRRKDLLFRKLWLLLSILAGIPRGREPDMLVRSNIDSLCFRTFWLLVDILARIPRGREPGLVVWRISTLSRTSTLRNI